MRSSIGAYATPVSKIFVKVSSRGSQRIGDLCPRPCARVSSAGTRISGPFRSGAG
jgi:hypothetical protein